MVQIECRPKKWGSSLGIIIPKEIADDEDIDETDNIIVDIKKAHKMKEFFGMFPEWKKSTKYVMKEVKKGWD